jgi:hypothetical protein
LFVFRAVGDAIRSAFGKIIRLFNATPESA